MLGRVETEGDEIQVLIDKQSISEVLYRYCRGVDRGDRDLIASVYWDGAVDDHIGLFSAAPPELVDMLVQAASASRNLHILGNILIERLHPCHAWSESYVMAYVVTQGENPRDIVMAARYIDVFEKRGKEWRISYRRAVLEYVQDQPAVRQSDTFPGVKMEGCASREDPSYALLDRVKRLAEAAREAESS